MKNKRCRRAKPRATHFSSAARVLLASVLLGAGALLAQNPPKSLPVSNMSAFDSSKVGYEGLAIDLNVAGIAFEPLDYEIDRSEKFLVQARQEVAALENSPNPGNQAEAARLNQEISVEESHVQALQATKKLRQDAEHCGFEDVYADWQDLKQFIEEERQRMQSAAEMVRKVQMAGMGQFARVGGDAGTALIGAGAVMMDRQLETDNELAQVAQFNFASIEQACATAKQQKTFEDFKRNLEAANKLAEQAAEYAENVAKNGKFDDLPAIKQSLMTILEVARTNQLTGNEKLGLAQWQVVVDLAKTLLPKLAETCNQQSAQVIEVLEVDRTNQMLGINVDFSACYYRLYESSGVVGPLPYRMRHCGRDLSGTWHMQVTRGQTNNESGKLEGQTDVEEFANIMPFSSPIPNLSGSHAETAPAQIEAVGRLRDAQSKEPSMRVKGTIQISRETYTRKPGIIVHKDMKLRADMELEGFDAIPVGGGSPTHYPGKATPAMEVPITVINGNKPCDPSADVWSYPAGS